MCNDMNTTLKKFGLAAVLLISVQWLSSCDDFLELEPMGTQLEGNFYKNQDEVFQALVSVYDVTH